MKSFAIKRRTIAAYVLPALPISGLGLPLVVHLPAFYSEFTGLSIATVGLLFMLARLWDVVTDPVLGIASDHITTSWGRRRPWLVASVPVVMLSVWMIFMPPAKVDAVYLMGWLLVLYVGYTLITLSHLSWGAELSPDYHERSRVQGWREVAFIVGMLVVLSIPAFLELAENLSGPAVAAADGNPAGVGQNGGIDQRKLGAMGWFIIVMMPITVMIAVTCVGERRVVKSQSIGWIQTLRIVRANPALRRLLIVDFLTQFAPGASGATYIFFISHYADRPGWANIILASYFLSAVIGVPLWTRVSYAVGKHRTMACAMIYGVAVMPVFFAAPFLPLLVLIAINCLYGLAYGASSFLNRAMMADVCDYDELHTGQARTGLYFSLLTMTGKLGYSAAVGVTYLVLGVIGFSSAPGTVNTPEAVNGLAAVFIGFPVAAMLLAALAVWRFPLDQRAQEELRLAIAAHRMGELDAAAAAADISGGLGEIRPGPANETSAK